MIFTKSKNSTTYSHYEMINDSKKVLSDKKRTISYEKDLEDAGDNTKKVVTKAISDGEKEAKAKNISEKEKANYVDNYVKAEVAADNDVNLYNNAVINMAKSEAKSGVTNTSSSAKKTTESLASMESQDIPMSEYVKSKDESDYKKGTFTTTEFANSNYSDDLKEYQHKLNEAGVTDKFGDAVDEDGLWGAQTVSATKRLVESAQNSDEYENKAKEIFEEFSETISKFGDFGKGGYMSNYFSPTEIYQNKFFGKDKNFFGGTEKEYRIKFGEKSSSNKNPQFAVIDNKREGKNTRVFAAESHNMNIGPDSVNTPHYHIIKDAYTNKELDKVSKRLGYENTGEFLKNKFVEKQYSDDDNLHIHAPESAVNKAKLLKTANNVLDTTGKVMFWAGNVYDAARIGVTIYDDIVDDNTQINKKTVYTLSDVGGSWAGAALGASAGAKAGAAIGSLIFPAAGTAIGGAIGSAIGGAIGAYCGGKGASWVSEKIYDGVVD